MIKIEIVGDTVASISADVTALASAFNTQLKAIAPAAAPTPPAPPAPKPKAEKPKVPPAPPAPPAPPPAADGAITLVSLRERGRACIKAGKNADMKAALAALGADSITTTDPSKYAELDAALAAILDPDAANDDGL